MRAYGYLYSPEDSLFRASAPPLLPTLTITELLGVLLPVLN
jgi:hypothetical protein